MPGPYFMWNPNQIFQMHDFQNSYIILSANRIYMRLTGKDCMPVETHPSSGDCPCHGGDVRGFLQPRILLALSKAPACGYDLLESLRLEGAEVEPDTGNLYRTLRCMEKEGLVRSGWETGGAGPARRVYEITGQGSRRLDEWVVVLGRTRHWLDAFLEDYNYLTQRRSYERI
jgi:PadR family transcriptional regulator PadR